MKKVFLEDLPKCRNGKNFDWKSSIRYKIKFVYEDIQGEIEIIDYISPYLYIKYLNKDVFRINSSHFRKCQLGKLLDKKTNEFKVDINTILKNEKRNLLITDKKILMINRKDGNIENQKWYKYKCNKCGYDEGWIIEGALLKGNGCSCCSGNTVMEGFNDIPTTAPWMVKYFQGGYDEAKLYTRNSDRKIQPICPDCRRIRDKGIIISNIYKQGISCPCGDGISYPQKIMFSVLEQLNIIFKTEFSPKWSKHSIDNKLKIYRYDFYFRLNNEEYIIETDGDFHNTNNKMNGQTKEKSKEIDDYKDLIAIEHNIKMIRIDSRCSNLEFIKNSLLNSLLAKLFDLNIIDWTICEEFASTNLVKVACIMKRNNIDMTVADISKIMNLGKTTIRRYLERGNQIWDWCNYQGKEEQRKNAKKVGKNTNKSNNKTVLCVDTGQLFKSIGECVRDSEKVFGVKLSRSSISRVCRNIQKEYKGYKFKYLGSEKTNAI